MKILLIGIDFGNYEIKIAEEMRKQGHDVTYMIDTDSHYSIVLRLFGSKFARKISDIYQEKMLKILGDGFDHVIVIVGRQLNSEFLRKIRSRNPNALFSLYLWDDVKRVENFKEVKQFYDKIYSFDLKDCKFYGFNHLPLFYTHISAGLYTHEYDLYTSMYNYSERETIIKTISMQAKRLGLKSQFYISLGRYSYFSRLFDIKRNSDDNIRYIFKPISEAENYANMERAKAVIDVQFKGQVGLTMRTIECLGMNNKLITTNESIKYYDFYNENNVLIIDRNNPTLDDIFINTPYIKVENSIYEKYSLSTWVKVMLGEEKLHNYIGQHDIAALNFQ